MRQLGDIIQAATTIAVAAIFGHLIVRRLQQQDAFHSKLENELSRIVESARDTETRVAEL
ncbi:MAG: hypothetical protein IPI29_08880 [Ignavibacteria bacterium]|nr:hypothetical protein [Ignavibacteria bacterium]